MDQKALAGLMSPGKARTQKVRVAVWGEVLKEASWGGEVDQRPGRDEGRSIWVLEQERSWAKETANARSLRGTVLGAFDEDGLWGPETQGWGKGGGRGGQVGHDEVAELYSPCDGSQLGYIFKGLISGRLP